MRLKLKIEDWEQYDCQLIGRVTGKIYRLMEVYVEINLILFENSLRFPRYLTYKDGKPDTEREYYAAVYWAQGLVRELIEHSDGLADLEILVSVELFKRNALRGYDKNTFRKGPSIVEMEYPR